MRKTRKLGVIAAPDFARASILAQQGDQPIMRGQGDMDLTCGGCGRRLLAGLGATEIAAIRLLLFRCGACQAHNSLAGLQSN